MSPVAGQSGMVMAVQPLEVSLRATQSVDDSVGKRSEELVCHWGMAGEELMAGIGFYLQNQRVLLNRAGAVAAAAVNQGELAEDAGLAQPRWKLFAALPVEVHVHRAFHDHEAD